MSFNENDLDNSSSRVIQFMLTLFKSSIKLKDFDNQKWVVVLKSSFKIPQTG